MFLFVGEFFKIHFAQHHHGHALSFEAVDALHQQCAVLDADGVPFAFALKDRNWFCFAGLWSRAMIDGSEFDTFAIIDAATQGGPGNSFAIAAPVAGPGGA